MKKGLLIDYVQKELEFIPKQPSVEWEKNLKDSLGNFGLTKEDFIEVYEKMLISRYFEMTGYEMFFNGEVPGYFHSGAGQEAVAFGAMKALRKDDYVVSNYRGHIHLIAKGGDINKIMAEILGKSTGYCEGLGGSMYTVDVSRGFLYSSGIVSATIPVGVGVGLGIKLGKGDKVVLSFFGDGAANEGTFHECLNFASLWKLPVVFIVENNKYAITIGPKRCASVRNIAFRASGYNMPGCVVDGMDFLEVYLATREAVDRARKGEGPYLVEALTYRFHGHTRYDPAYGLYRSKNVLEWYKANDPIERFERYLVRSDWLSEERVEELRNKAMQVVAEAVEFAKNSPYADTERVYRDVYADYPVYRG
ncbi:MAG: thiamine pyrophosphate-dependent dehydrogenase E1 component subunit alpha [Syntrophobacteraceae bacterium]|jgi:TPP-dependent pyruvate/acetoin dehydrogenase alpha subunit